MRNKSYILTLVLCSLFLTPVFGADSVKDLQKKQKKLQEEIEQTNKMLKQTKKDESATMNKLQLLGQNIKTQKQLIRTLYSNPPKHGGVLAAKILGDAALRAEWLDELRAMQRRIAGNREKLVAGLASRVPGADFGHILRQKGMFSYSGLDEGQVRWLRRG